MTNQQAPEIYTLHTIPSKGERPWSGIYGVRADAEHDAKVLRDATGRDWSVVRLVVADTNDRVPEAIAKLRHLYQNMMNGAVRDTASAKRIAEGLLAPAIEALERATPPAEQQAAQVIIDFSQVGTAGPFPVVNGRVSLPDATMLDLVHMLRPTHEAQAQQAATKAAPGEPFDECFPGEARVAVPQGLISAACFAIRNKRDSGKVLEQLRRYSVGDLSQPLAPQPAPAPLSESIDQLARKLEIIGVVGAIDGHDVVRRESVLEIARRAALAAQGGTDE